MKVEECGVSVVLSFFSVKVVSHVRKIYLWKTLILQRLKPPSSQRPVTRVKARLSSQSTRCAPLLIATRAALFQIKVPTSRANGPARNGDPSALLKRRSSDAHIS